MQQTYDRDHPGNCIAAEIIQGGLYLRTRRFRWLLGLVYDTGKSRAARLCVRKNGINAAVQITIFIQRRDEGPIQRQKSWPVREMPRHADENVVATARAETIDCTNQLGSFIQCLVQIHQSRQFRVDRVLRPTLCRTIGPVRDLVSQNRKQRGQRD